MPHTTTSQHSRLQTLVITIWHKIFDHSPSMRHISDAQGRDIGLSPTEIELLRYEHPSRLPQNQHRGL